jgi:hypothetical protein
MPVAISPPVKFALKPLRIFITIALDSVRHFAPSAATWTPDDPSDVIQGKAGDTVAVIAHEALMAIFDSAKPALEPAMLSLALDPAKSGFRAIKDDVAGKTDEDNCGAFELRYDYQTKGVDDPPVLFLRAENETDVGRLKFSSDVPSAELRKEVNEACAKEDGQRDSADAC